MIVGISNKNNNFFIETSQSYEVELLLVYYKQHKGGNF